ncbi:MAG TPA: ABC transporter substrate-binding protein [Anaerolineales bacterium]|nr:ABC transporter substrate-binding protein [Anaerolineales bacterium]
MRTKRLMFQILTVVAAAAFIASCAPKAAAPAAPAAGDLAAAAKAEGTLTTIALPHDWANYGEIIETYKSKYGMQVNELNPDAGSADELEAIRANKDSKGPQAPDVVDVGLGYGPTAKGEGLFQNYKVATWDTIPLKDADGAWWAEYYGFLTFEVIKGAVAAPADWADLLKPEYKGKVAMAGDVLKSNEAVMTVFGSGMARAGETTVTDANVQKIAQAGLEFWAEMNKSGNFIPVIADQGRIAAGETPVTVEWNYLSLANRDALKGNPDLEIVVPKTGVIAGPYAGAISAYAPHPNAAKLWWEFVMSDEGQLLYLKGYAYPIRYNDMAARGVIPADLSAKLPPAEDAARAIFLTVDQVSAAKTYITENWRKVVYGE